MKNEKKVEDENKQESENKAQGENKEDGENKIEAKPPKEYDILIRRDQRLKKKIKYQNPDYFMKVLSLESDED